jgi:hypothetical protein
MRQDMERIQQEIQKEIEQAKTRYLQEYEGNKDQESTNQDETSKNVKKLEQKVNLLAKSVYDLFKQFDEFNAKQE